VGQGGPGRQHQGGVIPAIRQIFRNAQSANGGNDRAIGTSRTCHVVGNIKRESEEALIMRAHEDG
jgi:hypothetical protein